MTDAYAFDLNTIRHRISHPVQLKALETAAGVEQFAAMRAYLTVWQAATLCQACMLNEGQIEAVLGDWVSGMREQRWADGQESMTEAGY